MSLQEGIIFVLCVGNGVRFCGEKVLCLDAHIDLRSNNHCLVTSGVELPHGLPHAEPVAVLHGDHSLEKTLMLGKIEGRRRRG